MHTREMFVNVPSRIETVVVGAGQAGLSMSWHLTRAGREHVVLDRRSTLGGGWQDRWDEFQLVSPNWVASLPGAPYDGNDPHGFMPRDEIAGRVARYARTFGAPTMLETDVTRMTIKGAGGFTIETNRGSIVADRVVVATGSYHVPRLPPVAADLPARVMQLPSHAYRNESQLPAGAVLVVGSGQSGVQIAEELAEKGRRVYLAVGSAGRMPRRYRGHDVFVWLFAVATRGAELGVPLPTVERLPDPRARLTAVPHLSGHHGGHETNLRKMAASGMTLVGHVRGADGERVGVADDLSANLARADGFFDERMRPMFDAFIEHAGIDVPPDDREPFHYEPPERSELDLAAEGISSVIWTTGYGVDYGWIDAPVTDDQGMPRHRRGVSDIPGLFFMGLLWQATMASATLGGPWLDGPEVCRHMGLPAADEDAAAAYRAFAP